MANKDPVHFIVLQPNTEHNPSEKFRITDAHALTRYINGAAETCPFVEFDKYEDAIQVRDEMNRG